jgi:hypothetical protein
LAAAGARPAVSPINQYLWTAAGIVDPATGLPYTYTQLQQQLGERFLALRLHFINFFLQDEMRLRPNFSLNIGVRYELILFPLLDDQAPYPLSRRINNDTNNVAPRIGFSWNPFKGNKTVIRGGYGMYYDNPGLNLPVNGAQLNGRRVMSYTVPGTDPRAPRFPNLLTAAQAAFATQPNINAFPTDFQIMYAHQASLQVERELLANLALNVQGQWAAHHHGLSIRDINLSTPVSTLADGRPVFQGTAGRPDSRFRAINLVEPSGNSHYTGLDITLLKRFSGGLQFSTTYGWAHALSNSNLTGDTVSDPTSRRRDYGNSNGDVRQTWVFQGLYAPELSNAYLRWLNRFEFSTMTFYNSGFPINVSSGLDLNNDLVLNDRPLFVARNSTVGPNFLQVDFRLARRFVYRDRYNVEAIAEAQNLMNRLNASCSTSGCTSAVVNKYNAPDFGRIIATRAGRQMQIGFRASF